MSLQPHEGSSETLLVTPRRGNSQRLQPHEGSSETQCWTVRSTSTWGFNPTRVRLKRSAGRSPTALSTASTPRGFV